MDPYTGPIPILIGSPAVARGQVDTIITFLEGRGVEILQTRCLYLTEDDLRKIFDTEDDIPFTYSFTMLQPYPVVAALVYPDGTNTIEAIIGQKMNDCPVWTLRNQHGDETSLFPDYLVWYPQTRAQTEAARKVLFENIQDNSFFRTKPMTNFETKAATLTLYTTTRRAVDGRLEPGTDRELMPSIDRINAALTTALTDIKDAHPVIYDALNTLVATNGPQTEGVLLTFEIDVDGTCITYTISGMSDPHGSFSVGVHTGDTQIVAGLEVYNTDDFHAVLSLGHHHKWDKVVEGVHGLFRYRYELGTGCITPQSLETHGSSQ